MTKRPEASTDRHARQRWLWNLSRHNRRLPNSQKFSGGSKQIVQWKKQLLERAKELLAGEKKKEPGSGAKELHTKIGQLTMENDFLSHALGRISAPGAKR